VQDVVVMMYFDHIMGQELLKFQGIQGFSCSLVLRINMLAPSTYIPETASSVCGDNL
jgi:hypothetical protein